MTEPEPRRSLLKRAQRLFDRGEPDAEATERGLVRRFASALTSRATAETLVRFVAENLGDLVDVAAARLLDMDDAAAQMAMFIEGAVERHGRDALNGIVLRRNLILDGTVLAFIEPILTGHGQPNADPLVVERARRTLVSLQVDVAALDHPGEAPPPDVDVDERLARLEEISRGQPLDAVLPYLRGEAALEEMVDFVFRSYTLFLQSFLMRSSAKMLSEMMASSDARREELGLDIDV